MSSPRSENQKIVSLHMDEELVRNLDEAVIQTGLATRSHFIRMAIKEKLDREGVHVPIKAIAPGARTDKPDKPPSPVVYQSLPSVPAYLNDDASAGLRQIIDQMDAADLETMRKAVGLFRSILGGKGVEAPEVAMGEGSKSKGERMKGSRTKA